LAASVKLTELLTVSLPPPAASTMVAEAFAIT
jgi:hypothetical protein